MSRIFLCTKPSRVLRSFFRVLRGSAFTSEGGFLFAAAPLELILIVCEENVEAGERSVTAADIALQFHLHLVGQLGRVHMLLERAEAIAQHDDFVEERLDRPALFMQACRAGTPVECPPAPLTRRHSRRYAVFLALAATCPRLQNT